MLALANIYCLYAQEIPKADVNRSANRTVSMTFEAILLLKELARTQYELIGKLDNVPTLLVEGNDPGRTDAAACAFKGSENAAHKRAGIAVAANTGFELILDFVFMPLLLGQQIPLLRKPHKADPDNVSGSSIMFSGWSDEYVHFAVVFPQYCFDLSTIFVLEPVLPRS